MMNLKKTMLLAFFAGFAIHCTGQTITTARFRISDRSDGIRSIELILDDAIAVGISEDGRLDYVDYLDERSADYNATRDFNHRNDEETIGNLKIKYYDNFDIHDPKGKLKSIGNIQLKYNNKFDIHDEFGTLKSIGNIPITYYNAFDIHDPKGKVKSIGNVKITYFNAFDINEKFGMVKSITGNSKMVAVFLTNRQHNKR